MKEVTHIDCPKEWESINDWDSHKPLLYLVLSGTEGRVIEFGSGFASTPSLEEWCANKDRYFKSFETNKGWAHKTGATFVESYLSGGEELSMYLFKELLHIGLLFVDCAPGDIRKDIINAYSKLAETIVVHDTEAGAEYVYGMAEVLSTFKYRLDYRPEGKPHTTVVSNFINVEEWV
jgi:hypothetical protein